MILKTGLLANPKALIMGMLLVLAMSFIAVVFGMLAATANPILIALGLGLIGGCMMLAVPRLSILLVLLVGLLMGALISLAGPQFGKLSWAVSLLGMLLLVPAFLHLVNTKKNNVPGFIWIAIVFLLYAMITTLLHWYSLAEFVAGFKRYFQVFGLMLALALLPLQKQDFRRWAWLLLGVALLQFPFALYELLVLVPKRGGVAAASFTTDVVAGSFGANLEGGSPGSVMVIFLIIAFGFIFARWRNGLISTSRFILISIILLLPLGMGETKIVLVMLPLVWIVLTRHEFARSPLAYLPLLVLGVAMTVLLGYVYITLIMNSTLDEVLKSTISYNFASDGYASYYLNRTTVLSFWLSQQGLHDPISFFFGNGLGSAYLGQISGHIALKYPNYGIDLTAASSVLWDLGAIGLALFIGIFVIAWRSAGKLYKESQDNTVKADVLAIQAAISMFLLFIVYAQDIVNLIGMEIIYAFVFGYLAHLCNEHRKSKLGKLPAS